MTQHHRQRHVSVSCSRLCCWPLVPKLTLYATSQGMGSVASRGEDSPVRVRTARGSRETFPACHAQPCGASVASPFPLLAQEVLQLVHELLRVKIVLTPRAWRFITRRVIVLL